jgi:hypothetical protein
MDEKKTLKGKAWDFLNSSFGLWFLSTCVVGLITFFYTKHQENQRKENEKKQIGVEQARQNASLVVVLLPYLASDDEKQWRPTIEVIKYLKENGELPGELESALMGIIQVPADSMKISPGEQAKINAAATVIDIPTDTVQNNNRNIKMISSLPARVYIQISDEHQNQLAKSLQTDLRKQNFLAPGIENVGKKPNIHIPNKTEVRYYRDEEKTEALRLISILKGLRFDLQLNEVPQKIPGTGRGTRPRHYEIWFSKS